MENDTLRSRRFRSNSVTQRDVAVRSGVTQATVSMVVNNDKRVRPETRTRVLAAIEELGYVPNLAARGLASRRTRTLAIVAPDLRHESEQFLMPVMQGLMEGLRDKDYFLNFSIRREDEDAAATIYRTIREKRLDGLFILSPHAEESTYLTFMLQAQAPFVLVNRRVDRLDIPCVFVDHESGAMKATDYLIRKNHRRIACIAGPAGRPASEAKLSGFRKALANAGLDPSAAPVVRGDFQIHGGLDGMRQILAGNKGITAVYAGNDFQALGAIEAAKEAGISVPRDLAVIGCDDWEMAEWVRPPLTTIHVPFLEMGQAAANMMCRLADEQELDSTQIEIPISLVERESA